MYEIESEIQAERIKNHRFHYLKRKRDKTKNSDLELKLPNELKGCLEKWNEGNDDQFGDFYCTHGD